MIWKQAGHTFRKPEVLAKIFIISILFLLGLREQADILDGFSERLNGAGQINVGLFIIHAFNYFDFYMNLLFLGLVMLVPDLAQEEYLTPHIAMVQKTRMRAGAAQLGRVFIYIFFYMAWFVCLVAVFSGIYFHNFSSAWPEFLPRMYNGRNEAAMTLIMVPKSALSFPMPVVLLLVLLRSYLGFAVLALIACLVIHMSGKSGYGIGSLLLLLGITQFIYIQGGAVVYCGTESNPLARMHEIAILPYTVYPFFSFHTIGVNFVKAMQSAFRAEIIWLLILIICILLYYRKGDIGDADRNE